MGGSIASGRVLERRGFFFAAVVDVSVVAVDDAVSLIFGIEDGSDGLDPEVSALHAVRLEGVALLILMASNGRKMMSATL